MAGNSLGVGRGEGWAKDADVVSNSKDSHPCAVMCVAVEGTNFTPLFP